MEEDNENQRTNAWFVSFLGCSSCRFGRRLGGTDRAGKRAAAEKHHGRTCAADDHKRREHDAEFLAHLGKMRERKALGDDFRDSDRAARGKDRQQKLVDLVGRAQITHAVAAEDIGQRDLVDHADDFNDKVCGDQYGRADSNAAAAFFLFQPSHLSFACFRLARQKNHGICFSGDAWFPKRYHITNFEKSKPSFCERPRHIDENQRFFALQRNFLDVLLAV